MSVTIEITMTLVLVNVTVFLILCYEYNTNISVRVIISAKMYVTEEKFKMYSWYLAGASLREVCDYFSIEFPGRPIPCHQTVANLVKKMNCTGCINTDHNNKRLKGPMVATEDIELNVLAAVENNINLTTRQIAAAQNISQGTVMRILKKHKYKSYKYQKHQEITITDMERRNQFCERIFEEIVIDNNFHKNILFTDESTFIKHGEPNSQNCRYWSKENLHLYNTTRTQYPEKLNVWAGIINSYIIGPFFIDGTLNGTKYLELLRDRVMPALNALNLQGPIWYQHDGAPPHYSQEVRQFLNRYFPNRWLGRGGTIEWPARSPDLNPLDFFYWGKLKSAVYTSVPIRDTNELRERILWASQQITNQQIQSVVNEFYNRLGYCLVENGNIFESLI